MYTCKEIRDYTEYTSDLKVENCEMTSCHGDFCSPFEATPPSGCNVTEDGKKKSLKIKTKIKRYL